MGSTTMAAIDRIMVQGQSKTAAGNSLGKEKTEAAFADCMQKMSSQLGQLVTAGQNSSTEIAAQSGRGTASADSKMDYEKCRCQKTEVKSCRENQDYPADEKVKEAVEDYEQSVKETVQDTLGITEEELETAMETLGLSVMDLTNPVHLAELTASVAGCETTDVLFLEDFQQLMQQVESLTENLAQTLQIPGEQMDGFLNGRQVSEQVEVSGIPAEEMQALNQMPETDGQPVEMPEPVSDQPVMEEAGAVTTEPQNHAENNLKDTGGMGQQTETSEHRMDADAAGVTEEAASEKTLEEADGVEDALAKTVVSVEEKDDSREAETTPALKRETVTGHTVSTEQPGTGAAAVNPEARMPESVETVGTADSYSSQVDTADVIRQIVEFTQIHTAERETTLEMQLNPAHLGKMYLELTSKEGNVTAKIYTQNELVREALEAQMADLKANLSQAGVKVEAVEISAEPHTFEHNLEQQAKQEERQAEEQERNSRQRRRINLGNLDDMEGLSGLLSEEEALVAKIMADNGNSVDFMA